MKVTFEWVTESCSVYRLIEFDVCETFSELEQGLMTYGAETICFAFIVFWMSCYCKCPVALPQGPMGWSAVCDCGIS